MALINGDAQNRRVKVIHVMGSIYIRLEVNEVSEWVSACVWGGMVEVLGACGGSTHPLVVLITSCGAATTS